MGKPKVAEVATIESLLAKRTREHSIPPCPYEPAFDRIIVYSIPDESATRETFSKGGIIVKTSNELGLDTVMIGATKRGALERLLRGEVLKRISADLPKEKRLIICN